MWSWVLESLVLAGLWLVPRTRHGWLFCAAIQIPWAVYGWATGQLGFVFGGVVFGFMYLRNWRSADVRSGNV